MDKIIAIAIDEYDDENISNLKNCAKDINSLISILSTKYQFWPIEFFSKPEQTTLSFLYGRLYDELINSADSDNVLLLFAGHGNFNPILGTSYWLCSDSKKTDVTTWLDVEQLVTFFKASPVKHIGLISDSCFSGAIFERNRGGGIHALDGKRSRQALTSGGIEPVSDGVENENSPFNLTLQKILSENESESFSFAQLSEKTILAFSSNRKQTPEWGSLLNSGDSGGSFFLKLNKSDPNDFIRTIDIPLELDSEIDIDCIIKLPFFNDNHFFKGGLINAYIQKIGYSIINDVRVFSTVEKEYFINKSKQSGFSLEIGYTIQTINDQFLSVVISANDYFGSIHPNYYLYSSNFALKPEREISISDLLDYGEYSTLEEFLVAAISNYAEEECKDILTRYSGAEHHADLCFSFNEEAFTIYYVNLLPHAFKACGFLEIPRTAITFKM